MDGWSDGICTLVQVSRKHLLATYAGLQRSLKQEWSIVQCSNQGLSEYFQPAETVLHEEFPTEIFLRGMEAMLGRKITGFPIK